LEKTGIRFEKGKNQVQRDQRPKKESGLEGGPRPTWINIFWSVTSYREGKEILLHHANWRVSFKYKI